MDMVALPTIQTIQKCHKSLAYLRELAQLKNGIKYARKNIQ